MKSESCFCVQLKHLTNKMCAEGPKFASKMKTNSRATASKMASVNSGYINIKHMQQMHIDNCDGYHEVLII